MATSGISMPPTPMLRRNGTGRITSDSRPTATVAPLSSTACPARRGRGQHGGIVAQASFAFLAPAHHDQ